MPTLYISREDGTLGQKGNALCWRPGRGGKIETLPATQVSDVVVLGSGNITTQALTLLMDLDIPVHYVSSQGQYKGSLTSGRGKGYAIRRLQYEAVSDASGSAVSAQNIITGKILNQRNTLLRYLHRNLTGDRTLEIATSELKHFARRVVAQENIENLRGIEGIAAASYFNGLSRLFKSPWIFRDRNRRPPKDPINALLSFGYTMLLSSVTTAAIVAGLDPCVGFIHPEYRGRPSLALDLMEEFRSPIVDRLVVALCNQGRFSLSDFTVSENMGVNMSAQAKKFFIRSYSDRIRTEVSNESTNERGSYENHIRMQAALFVRSLRKEKQYLPFICRE